MLLEELPRITRAPHTASSDSSFILGSRGKGTEKGARYGVTGVSHVPSDLKAIIMMPLYTEIFQQFPTICGRHPAA